MSWGDEWGDPWGDPLATFDYVQFGQTQTWKHLQYLPNIRKVIDLIAEAVTEVDAAAVDVASNVGIELATALELDDIGDQVNFPRLGANDPLYRRALKAAARRLLASGRPDDFYDIVAIASPGSIVKLTEIFPACLLLWIQSQTLEEARIIASLLDGVPGLGICAFWIEFESQVFTWGHSSNDVPVEFSWDHSSGDIPADEKAGMGRVASIQ